ncbi:O-antigen ligase family protein [Akkermansiaceae bacterium]|nr:O-antigen ligase family protein [Akkermansiaceae bacterium]
MLSDSSINTKVFSMMGFSVAAMICMGFFNAACNVFLGRPLIYIAAVAVMAIAAVGVGGVNIRREALSRIAAIATWYGTIGVLTIVAAAISLKPEIHETLYSFALIFIILSGGCVLSVLCWQRKDVVRIVNSTFFFGFVVSAVLVIIDPIVDIRSYLSQFDGESYDRSRAGGLFLQPNSAALGLLIFFLILVPRLSRFWLLICFVLLGVGTLLTFSRFGIFTSLFAGGAAVIFGRLNAKPLIFFIIVISLIFSGAGIEKILVDGLGVDEGSGLFRINNSVDLLSASTLLEDERGRLLNRAWNDFMERPWIGYGPGYSWRWEAKMGQGTHNIYLRYMLDYGILGFLFWPSLMCVLYSLRQAALPRYWALTVFVMSLLVGLSSHNLSEQNFCLIGIMAAYVLPLPNRSHRSAQNR